MSKLIPTKKVILLSSIKSEKEKPATLSFWLKIFPVHLLGTQKGIQKSFGMWGKTHGYDTEVAQAAFRNAVVKHSNYYFRWATQQVCKWKKSGSYPAPIIHIHGTKDKTFPFRKIKSPVIMVKDGNHVMLHTRASEISQLINAAILEAN